MLKKILFALMFAIVATVTHAESDLKTAASKAYVDTMVETRQDKIPAANQQGVGAGETVMTYTAAGNGAIGERGIYTGANAYNANSDADKLITASALNDTFTNLHTTDTTKLECANLNDGCTLWTIVDQTAYGKSRNLFDLNTMDTGQGWYNSSGVVSNASSANRTIVVPCKPNTKYSVWHTAGGGGWRAFGIADNETIGSGVPIVWSTATSSPAIDANVVRTFTTGDTHRMYINAGRKDAYVSRTWEEQLADFMVVEGEVETALPYEPY